MFPGWWQIIIVLILVLLLFGGRGRISAVMGDFARGIRSFREGLDGKGDEADEDRDAPMRQVEDDGQTGQHSESTADDKTRTS